MENPNGAAPSPEPIERRHRRFNLQCPVRVKVHSAGSMVEFQAVTSNISMSGLLLETSSPIPQHTAVSFIVTVRSAQAVRPLQFAGEGKVVRVDPKAPEPKFSIAVECDRPISQINADLAPTGS
jgi:hypothetical protein